MQVQEKQSITLKNGSGARVDRSSGNEILQVHSASGEIIFEYDADNNRTTLHIQKGDLDFMVPNGNINMVAGQNIRLFGQNTVDVASQNSVSLATHGLFGEPHSSFRLKQMQTDCKTGSLNISSRYGNMVTEESHFVSDRFHARFKLIRMAADKCETIAKTIIEKARNVFRRVEGTNEVKAGRQRTMINGTYHVKSKKAFLKSEEDYKIKADKIHLG